jgi:O-6-methylguanine DNA methyltransferase
LKIYSDEVKVGDGMSVKKIYYDLIPETIIGQIWLAATESGLIKIDFDLSELEFVKSIRKSLRVQFADDKSQIIPYSDQINAYFECEITNLDIAADLSNRTPFQQKVLNTVREIPYGQVVTYSELAKRIGDPNAFRAVGQALRRNPVPLVIPCHRVIHSDGTLGGYGGAIGSERKIKLLKFEGVILT